MVEFVVASMFTYTIFYFRYIKKHPLYMLTDEAEKEYGAKAISMLLHTVVMSICLLYLVLSNIGLIPILILFLPKFSMKPVKTFLRTKLKNFLEDE